MPVAEPRACPRPRPWLLPRPHVRRPEITLSCDLMESKPVARTHTHHTYPPHTHATHIRHTHPCSHAYPHELGGIIPNPHACTRPCTCASTQQPSHIRIRTPTPTPTRTSSPTGLGGGIALSQRHAHRPRPEPDFARGLCMEIGPRRHCCRCVSTSDDEHATHTHAQPRTPLRACVPLSLINT